MTVAPKPTTSAAESPKVRLDKWLWAARFFKTRALAKDAIAGGKVRYNGERPKPGRLVEVGAQLAIRQGWSEKIVMVSDLSENRGPASVAQQLYKESEDSIKAREDKDWQRRQIQAAQMPPARRPTKKQRRQIHRFKDSHDQDQV
jgi:ribosome-associated heat shock protein Hsp15